MEDHKKRELALTAELAMRECLAQDGFNEGDHPRSNNGQFGSGGQTKHGGSGLGLSKSDRSKMNSSPIDKTQNASATKLKNLHEAAKTKANAARMKANNSKNEQLAKTYHAEADKHDKEAKYYESKMKKD